MSRPFHPLGQRPSPPEGPHFKRGNVNTALRGDSLTYNQDTPALTYAAPGGPLLLQKGADSSCGARRSAERGRPTRAPPAASCSPGPPAPCAPHRVFTSPAPSRRRRRRHRFQYVSHGGKRPPQSRRACDAGRGSAEGRGNVARSGLGGGAGPRGGATWPEAGEGAGQGAGAGRGSHWLELGLCPRQKCRGGSAAPRGRSAAPRGLIASTRGNIAGTCFARHLRCWALGGARRLFVGRLPGRVPLRAALGAELQPWPPGFGAGGPWSAVWERLGKPPAGRNASSRECAEPGMGFGPGL